MGVPSFYRWLVDKYPKIVVNAVQISEDEQRRLCSSSTSHPPPNGVFDNLYLDMNGIIHPCFHPEDQLFPPTSYDEVFVAIFDYIDQLVRIVQPRKLLYMAIDGVAPRAKMNQQRCRRFKTAKEAEFAEAEESRLRREYEMKGMPLCPKQKSQSWDSNVITPGTVFMELLLHALEYYIRLRLNTHPLWKDIKVILSGANVPGEGEHKIMSFIRLQRNLPGYDPNSRHCLYGLDADLIMLALATHEIHFSILREVVLKQNPEQISLSSLQQSLSDTLKQDLDSKQWYNKIAARIARGSPTKPYQFLCIWTLREYLQLEFTIPDPPCEIDIERIVDDFVFICFFTGNDFLPNIPSIETHECALDLLIHVYKAEFKHMGGYLVDTTRLKERKTPYVKVKRIEKFFLAVSKVEQKIFEKRNNLRQLKLNRVLQDQTKYMTNLDYVDETSSNTKWEDVQSIHQFPDNQANLMSRPNTISSMCKHTEEDKLQIQEKNTREMIQTLKSILRDNGDLFKSGCLGTDRVRLYMPGAEDRYYRIKFSLASCEAIDTMRKDVVQEYIKGMCWTVNYYYDGVCSWNWFYPFHHGPLASSMKSLSCSSVMFKMGSPFKPLDQLMAVLPPQSGHALPKAYQELMISEDSIIQEFYPTDFQEDIDGKRFSWQSILKLPFIKEDMLLAQTQVLEKELKEDECRRNRVGNDKIFSLDSNGFGEMICHLYEQHKASPVNPIEMRRVPIVPGASIGINGYLTLCEEVSRCNFPLPMKGMEDIEDDHVLSAIYENPDHHIHIPRLLMGVEIPAKTVTIADMEPRQLWHEYPGSRLPTTTLLNRTQSFQPKYTATWGRGRGTNSAPSSSSSLPRDNWKGGGIGSGPGRGIKQQHFTFNNNCWGASNRDLQTGNIRSPPGGRGRGRGRARFPGAGSAGSSSSAAGVQGLHRNDAVWVPRRDVGEGHVRVISAPGTACRGRGRGSYSNVDPGAATQRDHDGRLE